MLRTRHPLRGILIPLPLFVLGHEYNVWGLLDVAVFAVCVGVIVWQTEGLEGAIALHAANNTVIFAGAAVGLVDQNSTDISPGLTVLSIGVTALTSILIIRDYTHQRARSAEAFTGRVAERRRARALSYV